ncbi:hypothetical protein ILUMI_02973 [Ignelater luminosus]|uniref:HTH CENPB-type domain-containing protein n=1 Tax=Ignelater luminosus TaxID=2038154 RepID=A0A8K0DH85_IGNLU|nr:hypothetical protein ILUMI_02973 [Ignelater luminosus]
MEKQNRKALMLKDKYDIIQKIENGVKQSDICCEMSHEEVDKGLLQWFTQKRQENIPLSGSILQEKASEMDISLLDVVNFIHLAWQEVSRETNANCFKHIGFLEKEEFDSNDELPLNEWLKMHTKDCEDTEI